MHLRTVDRPMRQEPNSTRRSANPNSRESTHIRRPGQAADHTHRQVKAVELDPLFGQASGPAERSSNSSAADWRSHNSDRTAGCRRWDSWDRSEAALDWNSPVEAHRLHTMAAAHYCHTPVPLHHCCLE